MIYLDNAATSFPKPEAVYRALDQFARTSLANPGRTSHRMALTAEHVLKDARHHLNQLLNGEGPDRFAFTLNCTDALNMAIKGVVLPGEHVITSNLEHNSVSRPLVGLERADTISLTRVPADAQGTIDPAAIRAAIRPNTRLIAITHASNVLGTVQPIADIAAIAREKNILLLVDAAQTAGAIPIDIRGMGIDLLAFPGHKCLLGPTGTGALYVRPGVQILAWREGGTGGDSATPTQPREWPFFLEGGTPNVLGIAGLLAGVQFVAQRTPAAIHAHEMDLVQRLWSRLDRIPGLTVYGHRDPARHVAAVSFNMPGFNSSDIANVLDTSFDIAVRPGMHCSPYIHRSLGNEPEGALRVSPGPFSTAADIDQFADALGEIVR